MSREVAKQKRPSTNKKERDYFKPRGQRKTRSDKLTRTTIRMNEETYHNLRVVAIKCDLSMNDVMNKMFNYVMNNQELMNEFFRANPTPNGIPRVVIIEGLDTGYVY